MRITRIRAAVAFGAVAACAAASVVVSAGPASADPGVVRLTAVGSDTIQAVYNAFGASAAVAAVSNVSVDSYDALNPTTGIQDSVTAPWGTFLRANGSGQGRSALSAAYTGRPWPTAATGGVGVDLTGHIDIARSSGAPSLSGGQDATNSDEVGVPLARDAFGVAIIEHTGDAPITGVTYSDLVKAYSSDKLTNATKSAGTNLQGLSIVPWLPQSGSGTRKDFLSKLGYTDSSAFDTLVGTNHIHEENSLASKGTSLYPSMVPPAGTAYIVPFSAAQWIAQKNHTVDSTINNIADETSAGAGSTADLLAVPTDKAATTPVGAPQPYKPQVRPRLPGGRHRAAVDVLGLQHARS